jgi:hypothetical protein
MRKNLKTFSVALALIAVASIAYAVQVATYQWNNTVTITTQPGIVVSDASGPINQIAWGDLQRGTTKTHTITISNTGGSTVYIRFDQSLTFANLPSGVELSWTLDHTVQLDPGQQTSTIRLNLYATDSTVNGNYTFTINIVAFDTYN